jgi:hypothetical protein
LPEGHSETRAAHCGARASPLAVRRALGTLFQSANPSAGSCVRKQQENILRPQRTHARTHARSLAMKVAAKPALALVLAVTGLASASAEMLRQLASNSPACLASAAGCPQGFTALTVPGAVAATFCCGASPVINSCTSIGGLPPTGTWICGTSTPRCDGSGLETCAPATPRPSSASDIAPATLAALAALALTTL